MVVMAPVCRPFGSWARLNSFVNYEAWLRSYNEAAPLARFCGTVALQQLRTGRHFINEQPRDSTLYSESPWWDEVVRWPQIVWQDFDQCMTGLRANNGLLVRKPTRLVASHPALVHYFSGLKCDGSHEHQQLAGGGHTARA